MTLKKHTLKYNGIYRGKVLDNNDPSMYGRVRVEVYPMFNGIASANLPWAVPAFPIFEGAGSGIGHFSVPRVNSFVFVFFEQGDIYQPVYFAEAPTAQNGLPADRTTNYPDRKVLQTTAGFKITLDDHAQTLRIDHPAGTYVLFLSDGSITINSVKAVTVAAADDIELNSQASVKIQAGADMDLQASGTITIQGAAVQINP